MGCGSKLLRCVYQIDRSELITTNHNLFWKDALGNNFAGLIMYIACLRSVRNRPVSGARLPGNYPRQPCEIEERACLSSSWVKLQVEQYFVRCK